jgi:Ca2+-binding EF-hand superfamily protein
MKDIFIAIDEDGSGTMDQDELIKALLSLGLSQDITFAKRILSIFKDNKIRQ